MPIYKWRRIPTKYFGKVWSPFAQVEFRKSDGDFQAFALLVDSGAVVSLLRRSVAELLGIDLTAGREIELRSVGGARTKAYVHDLPIRFGTNINLTVPFAFATNEEVPNLLGRQGVFDLLQIDFDATLHEVGITAPWLDAEDLRSWKFLFRTEKHILDRWQALELTADTRTVAKQFVHRGAQLLASAAGLLKLHRTYAGPLLIRSLFELAIQFEYLMKDPDTRAKQYIDFQKISKYRLMKHAQTSEGLIGTYLRQSPLRKDGEKRVEDEYLAVRDKFSRKGKSKRRWDKWYCMSIYDLAEHLHRKDDYRVIYEQCSAWAHADPFSTSGDGLGPMTHAPVIFSFCIAYYARILLAIADVGKAILEAEQYDFLKESAVGIS